MGSQFAPQFVPVTSGRIRKGYYIAKRRGWRPGASATVVLVMPDEDVSGRLNVHQPGRPRVDDVSQWIFFYRAMGLNGIPAESASPQIEGRDELIARPSASDCVSDARVLK